jgi:hypothetical protein
MECSASWKLSPIWLGNSPTFIEPIWTPYGLAGSYQCFAGRYCFPFQGKVTTTRLQGIILQKTLMWTTAVVLQTSGMKQQVSSLCWYFFLQYYTNRFTYFRSDGMNTLYCIWYAFYYPNILDTLLKQSPINAYLATHTLNWQLACYEMSEQYTRPTTTTMTTTTTTTVLVQT